MATADTAMFVIPSSPVFAPLPETLAAIAAMREAPPRLLPDFKFTHDTSVDEWNVSAKEWLRIHDKHWHGLAVGAKVFDKQGRILLVQRAHHDSMPDKWECPGGAADVDDPSLLYSTARELFEETGMVVTNIKHLVTMGPRYPDDKGCVFSNRTGSRVFCRFSFEVDVESTERVTLHPNEHQDFVWATEEEVRAEKVGDRPLPITNGQMMNLILEAFRLRKD